MEKFKIYINEKITNNKKEPICKIEIGTFKQQFYISLDTWNLETYKKQWEEGLNRIKKYESSCLITYISFNEAPLVHTWYLYKDTNKILIQTQFVAGYIFDERAKGLPPFDIKTCYQYVPPFRLKNEEGQEFEIWEASLI